MYAGPDGGHEAAHVGGLLFRRSVEVEDELVVGIRQVLVDR